MAKKKKRATKAQKYKKIIAYLSIALVAVSCAFVFLMFKKGPIDFNAILSFFDSLAAPTSTAREDVILPKDDEAMVSIIDVGQGLSTYINAGGKHILIDGGENNCGERVVEFLRDRGVDTLELVIGTHPHSDHIGGLDVVIKEINTKMILLPPMTEAQTPTTKTFADLLDAIEETQTKLVLSKPGQVFNFGGGAVLKVLGPRKSYESLNNISIVSRFDFGDVSFLFTGDAEKEAEEDLLRSKSNDLDVDVLSAGHHGSSTSTTEKFLLSCSPRHVNISCGRDNKYGHPHEETIELLDKYLIPYNRTDKSGSITYITNGKSFEVFTEK